MGSAHRLYLYDFPEEEQALLRQILLMVSASGLLTDRAVNESLGFNVRYIKGLTKSEARTSLAELDSKGKPVKGVVPQWKWARVYNYCMNDLFDRLTALGQTDPLAAPILEQIGELQKVSRKSGRYEHDMHFFNQDIIRRDTARMAVEERFSDLFVSFRYSSDRSHIVFAATRIMRERKRDVFVSLIMGGHNQRETRGYVYELRGHLFLHGFIEEDGGGETFSLQWTDQSANVLYGVMTTIGVAETPHAKECIFIRASALRGAEAFSPDAILTELDDADAMRANADLRKLRLGVKTNLIEAPDKILLRADGGYIKLERFLSRDVLHALPPEVRFESED